MVKAGVITPLKKRKNSFLARSDPQDVARVESQTFVSLLINRNFNFVIFSHQFLFLCSFNAF